MPSVPTAPNPAALVLSALLQGISLAAQATEATPEAAPLPLKDSAVLQQHVPASTRETLPVFIRGGHLLGRPDQEAQIQGQAELRRGDVMIRADRLEYDQPSDTARARGQVRINRAGDVYEGPLLELKLATFAGFFEQPSYRFLRNEAHGQADRVDFVDAQHSVIHNASYTTCRRLPGPSWMPDWILRATTIRMDTEQDVGSAEGALLSFQGVPLLPIPYISFPLSDKRKSGLLPPTLGLDNVNGAEVALPYYWNIAPNLDATFTPTVMSKRGLNLGSEWRYLQSSYGGQLDLDVMPADQLRNSKRWGAAYLHRGRLDNGLTRLMSDSGVALSLNLNRVSDDNYWSDFPRALPSLTQRLLANDATLSWSNGNFASSLRTLKWQTLQDVSAPIVPPYDRLPQLTTRYVRSNVGGFDYSATLDYTRFQADSTLTLQASGQRAYSQLQFSRPWLAPAGFISPKLQLHLAGYQFDTPLSNGERSATRVVPTLSLDSGLFFERDASYFGRAFRQTLEPRAFYVNTPYRDQSLLPNYDSGAIDFNFASIYTENAFVGNDRISDSNLLTLGLTTRLLDPTTGAEAARFGVAQRLRFRDQNVTLPGGAPATDRVSDVLFGASVNWDKTWAFDSTVQFNPEDKRSTQAAVGARYNPGRYRTVTAAYRYQRELSEQLDLGWQWPLDQLWGGRGQTPGSAQDPARWYSVGRLNYSLNEGKLVDAIVGFEYDAGCWLGRAVLEKLQTSASTATQRIMFQLEFVGFGRLGVSPLKSLKDNVPNYQYLREPTSSPSRFSNYD